MTAQKLFTNIGLGIVATATPEMTERVLSNVRASIMADDSVAALAAWMAKPKRYQQIAIFGSSFALMLRTQSIGVNREYTQWEDAIGFMELHKSQVGWRKVIYWSIRELRKARRGADAQARLTKPTMPG